MEQISQSIKEWQITLVARTGRDVENKLFWSCTWACYVCVREQTMYRTYTLVCCVCAQKGGGGVLPRNTMYGIMWLYVHYSDNLIWGSATFHKKHPRSHYQMALVTLESHHDEYLSRFWYLETRFFDIYFNWTLTLVRQCRTFLPVASCCSMSIKFNVFRQCNC